MSDRWYYQMLMEEFGPVSGEFVLELLHEGTLDENDLVRSEAGGDWISIWTMKETAQTSDSSELPGVEEIQDLSELNFRFESSSPLRSSSTAMDSPVQSSRSVAPAVSSSLEPSRERPAAVRAESPVRKTAGAKAKEKSESRSRKPVVADRKRKRVIEANETPEVSRSKRISSNGVGVDDELADAVFSDVFQKQDTPSSGSLSATLSMATWPSSAGSANSVRAEPNGNSTFAPVSSASTVTPAALPRMAYIPPKKSVSVSEPMDLKKVGTVAGAITVIAGVLAIAIFGSPFGGGSPTEAPFDPKATAAVLTTIFKNFNDLTMTTDESAFAECMDNVEPQMAAILERTQDPQNNTPEAAACQAATKALMKIADALPDQQEDIAQGVIEFQKQIALVQ